MINKIFAAIAVCALFLVVGLIVDQEYAREYLKVDVQITKGENGIQTIRELMPMNVRLLDIQQLDVDKNEYRLTVSTPRDRSRKFLQWLKNRKKVEHVETVNQ